MPSPCCCYLVLFVSSADAVGGDTRQTPRPFGGFGCRIPVVWRLLGDWSGRAPTAISSRAAVTSRCSITVVSTKVSTGSLHTGTDCRSTAGRRHACRERLGLETFDRTLPDGYLLAGAVVDGDVDGVDGAVVEVAPCASSAAICSWNGASAGLAHGSNSSAVNAPATALSQTSNRALYRSVNVSHAAVSNIDGGWVWLMCIRNRPICSSHGAAADRAASTLNVTLIASSAKVMVTSKNTGNG